ncbi:MAG TPA: peptidase M61 [Janthinobacterium sp.]|jgi:predicted metalloprotease with PDZ domain|nr:peptidase M61 [Janthinobacterium sp.]
MTAQSLPLPRFANTSKILLAALLSAAFSAHAADGVPAVSDKTYPGTIVLNVDASNNNQQIFQIHESIPVKAGKLTLLYPQWLPGNHGPTGPLNALAGLKFSGNGKTIEWARDPLNVYAFHLEVPSGVTTVEAEYQFLSPLEGNQGRITMTDNIVGVQWNAMTLYPAGYASRRIMVQPKLTLPAGFQFGTALETETQSGNETTFKTLDLETLVDSPLFSGRYFKRIDLDPNGKLPVHLDIVADNPESLEAKPEQIAVHKELIQQAYKLYKSQHYKHYDFLFSLSDEFSGIGLEHHQSSEDGVKADYFTDWTKSEVGRDLLAHEYTHSWDGKFRRPAGQDVPNFNTPMNDGLLWVYEGQTQYWGNVLAARSGLVAQPHALDSLASVAARYDNVRGRVWRDVLDTTYDPVINMRRPIGWANWQRSEDYYSEGQLIWLDADTKIRELSGEKHSLNDFAAKFFGVEDGNNRALHYTFDDVVKALNEVQAYDWATFLHTRLEGRNPHAPLDGLTRGGWKLVYTDTPTDFLKMAEERRKVTDFAYSLGFSVDKDAKIVGIEWDGPAYKAGLTSGNTSIVAVNGKAYKAEVLKAAVKAAKGTAKTIELLVKKGEHFRTVSIDYHEGLKYPRLERIEGTPDRLSAIMAPMK